MAVQYKDRVRDTTTTTGTGNITLSGTAPTGRQSFNTAHGTSQHFEYCIEGAAEFEIGIGHLSASTTLVRDLVLESSNSDALVSFSAGTKNVFGTLAARSIPQSALLVSDFLKTNNTFSNVTDLTVPVVAGHWYSIEVRAYFSAGATGGFQFDLNGGSATATLVRGFFEFPAAAVSGEFSSLTLSDQLQYEGAAAGSFVSIVGIIQINAGGTLIPRFAQITTHATPSSVDNGTVFSVTDVTF